MVSLFCQIIFLTTISLLTPAPILNLIPACPGAIGGQAVIALKTDAKAYGLAKCGNGEKFFSQVSEVEHSIIGVFDLDYSGEYCQFKKKTGVNTFTLEIEIGWGESDVDSITVVEKTEQHVVTCAFDRYGMGIVENSTVLKPFLAPKETQRLLGIQHPSAHFELKVLDILDNDITNTTISLGRKIRLKVTETNSTFGFQCPAGFDLIANRCYHISVQVGTYSFTTAEDFCASMGSQLVALETREEFLAVKEFFLTHGIQGNFFTSGIIVGDAMAFWTTTGEVVIPDSECWAPGFSIETASDECIILESMWGEAGLRDTSCRSESGRSVMCEDFEPARLAELETVDFFKALSCDAKNSFTSYSILRAGCGDGQVFEKDMGFDTDGENVYSPYFESFRLQGEETLHYQCNFTVCDSKCDGDSCATEERRKRRAEMGNQTNIMTVRTRGDYALKVKDPYYSLNNPEIKGNLVLARKTPRHLTRKNRKRVANQRQMRPQTRERNGIL